MTKSGGQGSGLRQGVLWGVFSALLVAGLVLFFQHATVLRPLIEAVAEK